MTTITRHAYRNDLAEAYHYSEGLHNNTVALRMHLDVCSKRPPVATLDEKSRDYIAHNLINARANLDALERAIAEHMPILEHAKETSHA